MNRIFLQLDSLVSSGANTMRVLSYAKGFMQQGYKVALLVSLPEPVDTEIDGLEIIDIYDGTFKPQNKIRQNILFYRAIRKHVKEGDVIVFCGAPLYGFLVSKKIVRIAEETEIPLHGNTKNCFLKLLSKVRNYSLFKFDGLLVISQALKHYYTEAGFPQERIYISNMMVDATRFNNLEKDPIIEDYIAYCGSISNAKDGVDTLIRAFAIVHQRFPELKLKLAGKFATENDKEIDLGLIKDLHLDEFVILSGLISSCNLPQFLKNAKALVLARPDNRQALYGFPTKLGEYLLTGNPVVVTPVGDIPLFLEDGKNCYFAIPGDIEDIANKIMASISNVDSKEIGEEGRKVAIEYFEGTNVAKGVATFIKRLSSVDN